MTICNQHVIDEIERCGSIWTNKFIKGECNQATYGYMLGVYNDRIKAEIDLISSLNGKPGADWEPMFNGIGRDIC